MLIKIVKTIFIGFFNSLNLDGFLIHLLVLLSLLTLITLWPLALNAFEANLLNNLS